MFADDGNIYDQFDGAPATSQYISDRNGGAVNTGDEIHIIIIDDNGVESQEQENFIRKI